MLECINKTCEYNENNECDFSNVIHGLVECKNIIKPIHTPTYAEEQLNHAIEKEKILESVSIPTMPINYEEEYRKLKKDNEDYSVKITILEQEKKELEKANQGLAIESKQRCQTIRKLQRLIEDNTENATLRNEIEDLKAEIDSLKLKASVTEKLEIEINNLNAIIDRKDDEIQDLKNEMEERESVIYNGVEVEKNELQKLNEQLNNKIETVDDEYKEEIKQLKKERESHIKQIRDFARQHEEEQREKLLRQKENIDLKNAVKALASLL